MAINPHNAARFPILDGLTSILDVLKDPAQKAKLDAYLAWDAGYAAPAVTVSDQTADGPHGPIPLRVYEPTGSTAQPRAALVWLHGGGFMAGDLDMPEADVVSRELASRAGAVVVSVDYRLAINGVRFPIPHDDAVAAYRWVVRHAADLGVDPRRVSFGGASAGANLACGAALHLRDDGLQEMPAQLLLAYPLVHAVVPSRSREHEEAMTEIPAVLRFPDDLISLLLENYVGPEVAEQSDLPAYAMPAGDDLRGLPPVTIIVCEYDDLRPSGEALAGLLEEAGVTVHLVLEKGVLHGHLNEDPRIPQADHSLSVFADALQD